jgi:hypothetical protein
MANRPVENKNSAFGRESNQPAFGDGDADSIGSIEKSPPMYCAGETFTEFFKFPGYIVMVGFRFLFLDNKPEWQSLVERLPAGQQDIHFLPEYGEIYGQVYGFRPFLAVFEKPDGQFVIQPFVERPLKDLAFLSSDDADNRPDAFYDIANPYGYGGPALLTQQDPAALLKEFEAEFTLAAASQGWASEFTSVHPLLPNAALLAKCDIAHLQQEKAVVVIDLRKADSEIWAGFDKGHKSSVKKASRLGVSIERVPISQESLDIFHKLYSTTMSRRSAAPRWHFPDNFFAITSSCLGADRASLFFARFENRVIAAYFLIHAFKTAYLHFTGADAEWLRLSPNNLLMFETMRWAKAQGYETYHLGGGVTSAATDPLFSFKAGFSESKVWLTTYYRILNQKTYGLLCERKKAYELATAGKESDSDFFPLYRR